MRPLLLLAMLALSARADAQTIQTRRPFGTLREQAEIQQRWLQQRMDSVLPAIMRTHGVEMWVVPMREYNEDPTFTSLVSPTTFAARRRTIYVFVDTCAAGASRNRPGKGEMGKGACAIERIALGGTSQGGIY